MNCQSCETLLLRDQDGALSESERAVLNGHLTGCPACREFQSSLGKVTSAYHTEMAAVKVPDVEDQWAELQSRLAASENSSLRTKRHRIPASVLWLTAPLAAAAALALVFLNPQPDSAVTESAHFEASAITHVDYVETGDPNASTMVYIDQDSGWLVVWASHTPPDGNG